MILLPGFLAAQRARGRTYSAKTARLPGRAGSDPSREFDQRTNELRESLGLEAVRAAEHVAALHLPRQWKARREIDQPRHEVDVEERGREAAFGRRHPISRVEVSHSSF